MDKKNNSKVCIDCEKETTDYYPINTNRGKVYRCAECHEREVRNSVKNISTKCFEN
tara:strand:+ start:1666 stop:1833 length:168 start_codon:yes stop_codon:yes gene_type:complete